MLRAKRVLDGPIIHPGLDRRMGTNINGPSLIKVPDWVESRLARYYLYFAHHRGDYIRLALADRIEGPWRVHAPGVLPLADTGFTHHIASPEVVIDEERREIRLYFHGGNELKHQYTRLATSRDGLSFTLQTGNLMEPYARLFRWDGWHYALAMPGTLHRSRDGVTGFEKRRTDLFSPDMRHSAVRVKGRLLQVIYSNRGACPEELLQCGIDLSGDWGDWKETEPVPLLTPEREWEGGNLPLVPSVIGPAEEPVRQLRDPCLYEEDGRIFLLYSVAGEAGIALAELFE
ncbi:MAG TPA: hypothetical protein VHD15_06570 [Hyphomicrobiales bacterium]|nr:hypothetical protein [Hyphomicrobiales bacterium]